MSCLHNGLIFFQFREHEKNDTAINITTEDYSFRFTSIFSDIRDIGRIVTEKEYMLEKKDFYMFVSQPFPPIVYQLVIDDTLNVNMEREFDTNCNSIHRYIGNGEVTVNADYLAMLLFDRFEEEQVIRVFYRNETNFGLGHTHIRLTKFKTSINSISFLGYTDCDSIFVRSPSLWETYRIDEKKLVMDTNKYVNEFNARVNNTYQIEISASTDFADQGVLVQKFDVVFSDRLDMSTYLVTYKEELKMSYVYGDSTFRREVDTYYSGPNKEFGLKTKQDLRYLLENDI